MWETIRKEVVSRFFRFDLGFGIKIRCSLYVLYL